MGAVTGSVGRILTGQARPEFAGSWNGFSAAFTFIQGAPWHQHGWLVWILAACAIIVAARHRRDPALLAVTILPLTLAVIGYAFFVGPAYEAYYYLSLMPAAVLTVLLGLTAMPSPRIAQAVAVSLAIAAFAIAPARVRFASTLPRMPEYGPLLDGSRRLVERAFPVRAIRTEFQLPPTADPEFLYRILGGRIEPSSHLTALITRDGQVTYQSVK